jgi:hypothetical protein
MKPTLLPTRRAGRGFRAWLCGLQVGLALLGTGQAWAWDAATTHAGLTERALAVSKFHAVLAHQLGRALGPFEPLKLHASALDVDALRALNHRLGMLDPAGGYRPSADGVLTALGWVKAGAVLAKTPPELGRNHFLEPGKQSGLDDGPGLSGTVHAARLTLGGGATVRDAATGAAFDLEGMAATAWLASAHNDLGVQAFFDHWQRAVSAKDVGQRETALVRALLAMGGVLSVLEDMGQPAFVRNDFRGEFSDTGSAFENFVADRYGSVALPRSAPLVSRADFESFFVASDGKGLAQATQQHFFSAGTLPRDFRCVAGDSPTEAAALVNQSLTFAQPNLDVLDLQPSDRARYLVRDGVKIAAYQRVADRIHFFFDKAVYADVAQAWLPRVMGYAAGLADHLLRGRLQIAVSGDEATLDLSGVGGNLDGNTAVHVFSEDEAGVRQEIAVATVASASPATVRLPRGTHKLAAFAAGRDSAGRFVATGELTLP